jgi:hypothetical protein
MSYNVNGQNMLSWFYSNFSASNTNNKAPTTNFRINNEDINDDYIGIGTNSNIPVSQLYTINYFSSGTSVGNLFELNLPVFSGTINVDYKIWPPSQNNGLLIQFLKSTNIAFNYTVTCTFLAVGGGGGGGGSNQSNAGGGGGAGGVILGSIVNAQPAPSTAFGITIGDGGAAGAGTENNRNGGNGGNTIIAYDGASITAPGGGGGGQGKGSTNNVINASSGGSGSFENSATVGTVTLQTPSNTGVFQNMTAFGNRGSLGVLQNNDDGAGGAGGGAGGASTAPSGNTPRNGGDGYTYSFGATSITVGGGGGGGAREDTGNPPGNGGSGGGGQGGWSGGGGNGSNGSTNTGGGGGGAWNNIGNGGAGGSGTLFLYILPSGVSL